jgi:hypothetical protein
MVPRIALFICVAAALGQPLALSQAQSNQPLTVRLEAPSAEKAGVAETLKAVSALVSAIAWPAVFAVLLITQRSALTRLLESLVEVLRSSHHIKVADLLEVEVDRSARQAEASEPSREVSPTQVDDAGRSGRSSDSAREDDGIRAGI